MVENEIEVAVPGRRGEQRVPGHLAVVVRVDVDEPGRHDMACRVHDPLYKTRANEVSVVRVG